MTKSLGKSVINLYSNIANGMLVIGNQQYLSSDLDVTHFLTLLCKDVHAIYIIALVPFLAPVSVGIITGKRKAFRTKHTL